MNMVEVKVEQEDKMRVENYQRWSKWKSLRLTEDGLEKDVGKEDK